MAEIQKIVLPDNTEYDINIKAGSTLPIKNDLYIDKENGTAKEIVFTNEGTKIGVAGTGTNDLMYVSTCDSSNVRLAGIQMDSGSITVFSNGYSIAFRPNGKANTTGQVIVDTSGWMNGKGFHAATANSNALSTIERIGDMFFYRRAGVSGGSMTAGTFKTVDQIASSAWYPGAEVNSGFAIGYNAGQHTPLRYGKVRITATGAIQVSPNADLTACDWTVIAMWRNPSFTG